MNKIKAIIEKAEDGGFAVYTNNVNGAFGSGLTEEEAKQDFFEVLDEQAEFYKEKHHEYPEWYAGGYDVEFFYDLSGFFEAFPFINASKFAEEIGINPSLMRKYKGKFVVASEKQRGVIQEGYEKLLNRMTAVHF